MELSKISCSFRFVKVMNKVLISIFLMSLMWYDVRAQEAQDVQEAPITVAAEVITVQGTEMAKLQTVMDVMRVLPGVSVSDEDDETDLITVIGRGTPAIYVGNRKILYVPELNNILADRVKEIEILKHPGAEYDKSVQAVIIIRFKDNEKEGLSLNNNLRLNLTHKLSPSDNLTLSWRHKGLTIGTTVGWEEKRTTTSKTNFTNRYENRELVSEKVKESYSEKTEKWIRTGILADYSFNIRNNLSFYYLFANRYVSDGVTPATPQLSENPLTHHEFAIEYGGKLNGWTLSVGNTTFLEKSDNTTHKPSMESYDLRKWYDVRTYAKATRNVWKGSLSFGAEYEVYDLNVNKYNDNPSSDPDESKYNRSHAMHPDKTLSGFASIKQKFGRWMIEAGLRYEHYDSKYRPSGDDGLMLYLRDGKHDIKDLIKKSQAVEMLINNGELDYKDWKIYPSLKVSTKVGKSELTLKHTEYCISPDYAATCLELNDVESWEQKILWGEIASTTTLGWSYKWVNLAVSYNYYEHPICQAMSAAVKFNGPDYGALNIDLTLTPKVGIWSPMLNIDFQKQWFDFPLASGKDRLKQPTAMIAFNNTVTLPQNWIFRLNSKWHSRGANRNNYYFSSDLNIDASVQKTIPKAGLTFMLSCVNVLRNSYNDYGRYRFSSYGLSEGTRQRNLRVLSLTVQYKL